MNTIHLGIEVIDENCTGCYRCERVCPTGAIVMVGPKTAALAVIDNDKCIACVRCIDSCDYDQLADDVLIGKNLALGVRAIATGKAELRGNRTKLMKPRAVRPTASQQAFEQGVREVTAF